MSLQDKDRRDLGIGLSTAPHGTRRTGARAGIARQRNSRPQKTQNRADRLLRTVPNNHGFRTKRAD